MNSVVVEGYRRNVILANRLNVIKRLGLGWPSEQKVRSVGDRCQGRQITLAGNQLSDCRRIGLVALMDMDSAHELWDNDAKITNKRLSERIPDPVRR